MSRQSVKTLVCDYSTLLDSSKSPNHGTLLYHLLCFILNFAFPVHIVLKMVARMYQTRTSEPLDIRLDYLFQKTPLITPKKRTVQPEDAFEDTSFKPGFEIVKF